MGGRVKKWCFLGGKAPQISCILTAWINDASIYVFVVMNYLYDSDYLIICNLIYLTHYIFIFVRISSLLQSSQLCLKSQWTYSQQSGSCFYLFSQDPCDLHIFTYIDPIRINHSWIGKCTVRPTDPIWDGIHWPLVGPKG